MKFSINNKVFNNIATSSNKFSTNNISFMYNKLDNLCLGFIIPKSLGAAHKRNKFKRRCRAKLESLSKNSNFPSVGIVVKPKVIDLTFGDIEKSFNKLEDNVINKYHNN
mgnify:FL=1|tara:strand:- start:167 stop:493 length:327 start_codon:yes stop_codon:yes gene_type:complete